MANGYWSGQIQSQRARWHRVHGATRTLVSAPLMTPVSHLASLGCGVGSADKRLADRSRLCVPPHLEAGAGGDGRRWPSVDGADDLAGIDALEVDAGNAEVGVLALNHNKWDALVRHLDRMGVPQLMRREPPPHTRVGGCVMHLFRAADASHRRPAVGP
jgi:hypothetical protein